MAKKGSDLLWWCGELISMASAMLVYLIVLTKNAINTMVSIDVKALVIYGSYRADGLEGPLDS